MFIFIPRTATSALIVLNALLGAPGVTVPTGALAESTQGEVAQVGSGIAGQVTIQPVRPVEKLGVPNLTGYQTKLEVLDAAGRMVTTVETDPSGNFHIDLPPGKYVLRPQFFARYPRASEQTVVVSPKSFTQVHIVYDSGIR